MWAYFSDILWLNEEDIKIGGKPKANPIGFFTVTTWIILAWHVGSGYFFPNNDSSELLQLESKLDDIAETTRDLDFKNNQAASDLDIALSSEYEAAFNDEVAKNHNLSKQVSRLRNEIDQKNLEWKECRHPGALDRHRD